MKDKVKADPRALGMQMFMMGMVKILEAKEDQDCREALKRINKIMEGDTNGTVD